MSKKFETGHKVPGSSKEPQLTAYNGAGEVENVQISGASRDECAKILSDLNHEAANYCILASSLGTKTDGDLLRCKLRMSRLRAWDHAKHAQNKLIPVLRRNLVRSKCTDEMERMYRAFSACLEFLEQQYFTTMLIQMDFNLYIDGNGLINAGLSETPSLKKCYDKLVFEQLTSTERSLGITDLRISDTDDVLMIQREMDNLHELIYSMNQTIAIQAWEIDPDMETEKITIAIENETSVAESSIMTANLSEDPDNGKIRCVFIVILTIMLIIVAGIVGILMGLLD